MNLGQARSLVRMYINEVKAQTWTDAQLNSIIQEANREVYSRIVALCPQWFGLNVMFTWPANTPSLYLPTVTTLPVTIPPTVVGNLTRVLGVFKLLTASSISATNVPMPLRSYADIPSLFNAPLFAQAGTSQAATNTAYSASQIYGYCLLGPTMHIWPVPTQDITLSLYAIPTVNAPGADGDNLLVPGSSAGTTQLTDYHELVPLLAAVKAKTAVGDQDGGLSATYKMRLESTERVLAISQTIQNPAQVRGVSV